MFKSYTFNTPGFLLGFVLLVCLIGVAAAQDVGEASTNESVALAFLAARGSWDAEALKMTLANELESYDIAATAEDYDDALAYYEAVNWTWTTSGCTESSDNAEQVSCSAQLANDWTRALDIGPFSMTFDFVVKDGNITTVDPQWNREFIENGLQRFFGFLQNEHPDDFELLYGSGQTFLPRGEEALELLKLRTADFASSLE